MLHYSNICVKNFYPKIQHVICHCAGYSDVAIPILYKIEIYNVGSIVITGLPRRRSASFSQ